MALELSSEIDFLPPPPAAEIEVIEKPLDLPSRFDPYFGSRDIVLLDNNERFQDYLNKKDAALVMFYDPAEPKCAWSKDNFVKASRGKLKNGHGFAVVDCSTNSKLCSIEAVDSVPSFMLYFKGRPTCYIREHNIFPDKAMLKLVDNADLIDRVMSPSGEKVKSYCEALWNIVEKVPVKTGRNFYTRSIGRH